MNVKGQKGFIGALLLFVCIILANRFGFSRQLFLGSKNNGDSERNNERRPETVGSDSLGIRDMKIQTEKVTKQKTQKKTHQPSLFHLFIAVSFFPHY